ncbi:MAG TPA: hypothetical protein VMP11_08095 [Verrucomicrobiae bacterium]|nr:hypothetical protein [Verrucomicrobiae bacterium]
MNANVHSASSGRRFVGIGLTLVLGALVASGTLALHVLRHESAGPPVMMLAGGILWIAILLWGILFVQMMAFLKA